MAIVEAEAIPVEKKEVDIVTYFKDRAELLEKTLLDLQKKFEETQVSSENLMRQMIEVESRLSEVKLTSSLIITKENGNGPKVTG